jgi:hypothetical protein
MLEAFPENASLE